ncbi:MAG: carboxylate--amine ligase, partial [Calditrichaeota bacterium]|nr:carboxylate--amine ligase [Calditrichota bacterium]
EWVEEVAEIGKKFFLGVGLRGLGNVEFKKDLRDGQWKIIECNPRFTAAHEQLVRCGMDISLLIYNHLAGRPLPSLNGYKQNVTLWFPRRDYLAYKELKALNELSFWGWMKSIAKPQVLPHFRWSDPMPTLAPFWDSVKNRLSR